MSEVAIILLAAAAALSVVELAGGPCRARAVLNRYTVKKWLLFGLSAWSEKVAELTRVFWPSVARLRKAEKIVQEDLGEIPNASTSDDSEGESLLASNLKMLASGGAKAAFYQLEADQLAAQISAVTEGALDRPSSNRLLLVALASLKKAECRPEFADSRFLEYLNSKDAAADAKAFGATRRQLVFRIQRRLDHLQIRARSVQEIWEQGAFIAVAVVVTWALTPGSGWERFVLLGIIAGFISPLIRRILRALGR